MRPTTLQPGMGNNTLPCTGRGNIKRWPFLRWRSNLAGSGKLHLFKCNAYEDSLYIQFEEYERGIIAHNAMLRCIAFQWDAMIGAAAPVVGVLTCFEFW